jgi:hypothetical protein
VVGKNTGLYTWLESSKAQGRGRSLKFKGMTTGYACNQVLDEGSPRLLVGFVTEVCALR